MTLGAVRNGVNDTFQNRPRIRISYDPEPLLPPALES